MKSFEVYPDVAVLETFWKDDKCVPAVIFHCTSRYRQHHQ
jgi:hypothetical protein